MGKEYYWVKKSFLDGEQQEEKPKGFFGKLFKKKKKIEHIRGLTIDLTTYTNMLMILSGQKHEDVYVEYAIQGSTRDNNYILPEEIPDFLRALLYVKGRANSLFIEGEEQEQKALNMLIAFYQRAVELQAVVVSPDVNANF